MPQKWIHLTTNNTDTEGGLNYQQRRLKHNKVRPSDTESQINNSSETSSSKPEEESLKDPDKVEPPQRSKGLARSQASKGFSPIP